MQRGNRGPEQHRELHVQQHAVNRAWVRPFHPEQLTFPHKQQQNPPKPKQRHPLHHFSLLFLIKHHSIE
jgi:hypothetical protein